MENKVPCQTVTRAASRRLREEALMRATSQRLREEAARALAAGPHALTENVPAVRAPTAPSRAATPPIVEPAADTPRGPIPALLAAQDANNDQDQPLEERNEAGEMMEWMETCASVERSAVKEKKSDGQA